MIKNVNNFDVPMNFSGEAEIIILTMTLPYQNKTSIIKNVPYLVPSTTHFHRIVR